MDQCITLQDIVRLTNEEAEALARSAEAYNPATDRRFSKQVRSLESSVIQAYKLAVFLAKKTTDPEELCTIWKCVSDICDAVLRVMKGVKDSRPECGTPQVYDLVLDYKNAAFKRYQLNLEARQWKDQEIPKGLFPVSS